MTVAPTVESKVLRTNQNNLKPVWQRWGEYDNNYNVYFNPYQSPADLRLDKQKLAMIVVITFDCCIRTSTSTWLLLLITLRISIHTWACPEGHCALSTSSLMTTVEWAPDFIWTRQYGMWAICLCNISNWCIVVSAENSWASIDNMSYIAWQMVALNGPVLSCASTMKISNLYRDQ